MIRYWVFDQTMLDTALQAWAVQAFPGDLVTQAAAEQYVTSFLLSDAARETKMLVDAQAATEHRTPKP